jgi:hypothetical protein
MSWSLPARIGIGMCASFVYCLAVQAAEHRIEVLEQGPPDVLATTIASQMAESGVTVIRGESRTVCQIWPCKQWSVATSFKPSDEVLYPFGQGQLVGVIALKRKTGEFRDRDIPSGVYTLRYARQPTDGNHEGTFPTRDFLLMVSADDDKSADSMDLKELIKLSAKAAEASHPAMICLIGPTKAHAVPAIRHDEDGDWWIAQIQGNVVANGKASKLRLDLVVAGHAKE